MNQDRNEDMDGYRQGYQAGYDVGWELDFWGRFRRGIALRLEPAHDFR